MTVSEREKLIHTESHCESLRERVAESEWQCVRECERLMHTKSQCESLSFKGERLRESD